MLNELCSTSDREIDEFVGLKFVNGKPKVIFPRGYHVQTDEKTVRDDIIKLLAAIHRFQRGSINSGISMLTIPDRADCYPFVSYQYILKDFLTHGYYTEKEVEYIPSKKGKINWKRTIQKGQPQIDNDNAVYLDFYVKTNRINNNNLISKIHEYCVYDSFCNIGWLYFSEGMSIPKPSIPFNQKLFLAVLRSEFSKTFSVSKKLLFQSMINIIEQAESSQVLNNNTQFGTNRFEYVWEGLIDYVFGIEDKEDYFPHAQWHIIKRNGKGYSSESSALEPDTIMSYDGKIYILDAKYYKYGITHSPMHLPATSSIQKQITYGEYVDGLDAVKTEQIFNAFIMPFDKDDYGDENYRFVSVGTADWKTYSPETPNYNYVLGILLDVRHLINTYVRRNDSEMSELSQLIEKSIQDYKVEQGFAPS